jgi:hypothetical protein
LVIFVRWATASMSSDLVIDSLPIAGPVYPGA